MGSICMDTYAVNPLWVEGSAVDNGRFIMPLSMHLNSLAPVNEIRKKKKKE